MDKHREGGSVHTLYNLLEGVQFRLRVTGRTGKSIILPEAGRSDEERNGLFIG